MLLSKQKHLCAPALSIENFSHIYIVVLSDTTLASARNNDNDIITAGTENICATLYLCTWGFNYVQDVKLVGASKECCAREKINLQSCSELGQHKYTPQLIIFKTCTYALLSSRTIFEQDIYRRTYPIEEHILR